MRYDGGRRAQSGAGMRSVAEELVERIGEIVGGIADAIGRAAEMILDLFGVLPF